MLIKRAERQPSHGLQTEIPFDQSGFNRRTFLRRAGLAGGSLAALGTIPLGSVRQAHAGPPPPAGSEVTIRKSVCTHCSVGCTVTAEVANGVWIGQEPSWDSPINRGSHCAKGASVRELVSGERRLKYPMKMSNGEWNRLSWEQAISEIAAKDFRDTRPVRAGLSLLARLRQDDERGRISFPKIRRVLGHQ